VSAPCGSDPRLKLPALRFVLLLLVLMITSACNTGMKKRSHLYPWPLVGGCPALRRKSAPATARASAAAGKIAEDPAACAEIVREVGAIQQLILMALSENEVVVEQACKTIGARRSVRQVLSLGARRPSYCRG